MEIVARAAIAGVTMAGTLLGYSLVWNSYSRHGTPLLVLLIFILFAVIGATIAKALVRFTDKRTVFVTLLTVGAVGGLIVGLTSCTWCEPLRLFPRDIAWLAAWSFAGALLGTLPRR